MLPQETEQLIQEPEEQPRGPQDIVPEKLRTLALPKEEEPKRTISLAEQSNNAADVDDEALEQRIMKAVFAMGINAPDPNFLRQDFEHNMERESRKIAAMNEAASIREIKHSIVGSLMQEYADIGQQMPQEDFDLIMGLSRDEMVNPETILEKKYAQRYIETSVSLEDPEVDPVLQDAMEYNEEAAHKVMDAGETAVTTQEIAIRNLQEIKKQYDDTGYLRWGVDFAVGLLPGVSWENLVDRSQIPTSSRMTGENIRQTIQGLERLTPEEYKVETQRMLKELADENIHDALYLAQALVSYTYSDEYWDNLTFGLDVVDLTTIGASLGAGAWKLGLSTPIGTLVRRLRSATRANGTTRMTVEDGLVAANNVEQAAVELATKRLAPIKEESPNQVRKNINELGKYVPSLLDSHLIARRPGSMASEATDRIVRHLMSQKDALFDIFTDSSVIQRYGPQAQAEAFAATKRAILRQYHKFEDAIVDIRPVFESQTTYGGVDRVDVYWGRMDATNFADKQAAEWHARNLYRLPKGSYDIVDDEGAIWIRTSKTFDETDTGVMDLRLKTDATNPSTPIQDFLSVLGVDEVGRRAAGWASPDDILADLDRGNRKIATFGMNRVRGLIQQAATDGFQGMSKKSKGQLKKVLEANHFEWRTVTRADGSKVKVQGNWHQSIGALENAWMKHNGRLPTELEVKAYFTFKNIMDFDWAFRNISVWKDKARLGIEQKSVSFMQDVDGKQMRMSSPFFEGREIDNLPHWGSEPFMVTWIDPKGKVMTKLSSRMYKKEQDYVDELIKKKGYRPIQTLDGGGDLRKTLKTGGEDVDYIVANMVQTKGLDAIQVEYRAGGHRIYPDHGSYLKQANVRTGSHGRIIRRGDTTAHWDPSEKGLTALHAAYETGRKMLLDGTSAGDLNKFIKANLPIYKSGKEFSALFRGAKGAPSDAPFDMRSPFVITRAGQQTSDLLDLPSVFGREFVDKATSEHNLGNKMFTGFTTERSEMLTRVRKEGTEDNPVFRLEPAQIMDPMNALSRVSEQLVNSRYFDDYKHAASETWAEMFGHLLDGVSPGQLKSNPLKYMLDPKFKKDADKGQVAMAKAQTAAHIQIMNIDNEDVIRLRGVVQKVADSISARAGQKADEIVDSWRWLDPKLRPAQWARSAAFHAYLGFFAVRQFKLQASAVAHIYGITGNPLLSSQAVLNYGLLRLVQMSANNKLGVAAKLAKRAYGMDETQFNELAMLYHRAGVHEFMGETAQLDKVINHRPVISMGRKVTDFTTAPFREGNLISRGSSFAAAYMEFRKANPLKKITDRELSDILRRASVMSVDQTRDSINPRLETGAPKFMLQFFTFQSRLSDQMIGTRLTAAEKLRVMAVWAMLYGPAVGTAGLVAGRVWPTYDHVREEAIARGWKPGENAVADFAIEGSLPMLVEWATGERFDITGSYGPTGLPWLRDTLRGDTTWMDVAAGAAGSFWGDVLRRTDPFYMRLHDVFTNPDEDTFQTVPEDYLNALRTISSVNSAVGAYYGLSLQEVWTKDGRLVGDIDKLSAVIKGLTGWEPAEIADTYRMMSDGKTRDRAIREISLLAQSEFRKGLYEMANNNDAKAMDTYFKRAYVYMRGAKLDPRQQKAALSSAIRNNEALIDKIRQEYIGKVPEEFREKLFENEQQRLKGE